MNLRVSAAGLAFLVLTVFTHCKREELTIGFPTGDEVVEQRYAEFVPDSYIMWRDSISTYRTTRLLVGKYTDASFGEIFATGYTQIRPSDVFNTNITIGDFVDSARFTLVIDYLHGADPSLALNLDVGVLQRWDAAANAFTFTTLALDSIADNIALPVDLTAPRTYRDTIAVNLDPDFAEDLFTIIKIDPDTLRTSGIVNKIPGFVFIPRDNNQVVLGINPDASGLSFWFSSSSDTVSSEVSFDFNGYSHHYIEPNKDTYNRTGTALEGLTAHFTRFDAPDDKVYFQSGAGMNVVLDMIDFTMLDTLQNAIITNAILEISGLENVTDQNYPPPVLEMYLLDDNLEVVRNRNGFIRKIYNGISSDSTSSARISPIFQPATIRMGYNEESNTYQADITLFMESLKSGEFDLSKIMLFNPRDAVSVNQFVTDKSNIKLRLFYSKRLPASN